MSKCATNQEVAKIIMAPRQVKPESKAHNEVETLESQAVSSKSTNLHRPSQRTNNTLVSHRKDRW